MLDDVELIEPRIQTKKVDASILVFHDGQDTIIALCKHPFNGNPDGCPNFGTTWNCPPKVPS
ncbi:hypothetical protein GF325_01395, partial [Candidatus Bathyarchaeota archaeon]|nr:hypothetical protein [Candidatus Bathyarchaeota archaeon]